jgi:mRNA interferase MazF
VRRGDLYRVRRPGAGDPKRSRVLVVVSRQPLVDSRFSTVVCAPVHSRRDGLASQVDVGTTEGLKHESSIQCDALMSVPKATLTDFVGQLGAARLDVLRTALRIALDVE